MADPSDDSSAPAPPKPKSILDRLKALVVSPEGDAEHPVGTGGAERDHAIESEVDRMAGSDTTPSNAGQQTQSSDHMNGY